MIVLIVEDDPAEQRAHAARWPNATILFAVSAAGARRLAAASKPDLVVAELAIPEHDGGRITPHQERVTLDHRLVAAEFPGTRFVRDLLRNDPDLDVLVHTWLARDHADVLELHALGVVDITHKGFEIPIQREPDRGLEDARDIA